MFILKCFVSCAVFLMPVSGFASLNHLSKSSSKHRMRDFSESEICFQEAVCQPLHNATCFGTPLPYSSTSIILAEDSVSQFEVQDNLALWQGLRSVPRCWAVVQPLLCAVYMPKCENGSIFLPSQEMCRITRGPCRSVEVNHAWPNFLRCENKKLFPPHCRNPLQEVKFNTSYKCVSPLVDTDNPDNWFHEVQGCGIQCYNPFFTKEEHNSTHNLISVLASTCFAATLFTVVTFMISWEAANRYPGIIIFYINVCLAVASFGWLIQFFPGAREEIVCLHDGTIRRKQPRSGEHLCSITFVLIYSFLMAAIVWFVILTYAWHVLFTQSGPHKDTVKKKVAYFHLSAWCIPLVLTTTIMAMKEVDGDSMSGICFVGYANMNMRIGFLLIPIAAAALIGGFFLICVLYSLIKVKLRSENVSNLQVKKKIHRMIFKIGFFSAFSAVFIICTFACHAYDFMNRKEWEESLREFITCLAVNVGSSTAPTQCQLKSKPSASVIQLHLVCLFGFGIMMSLWVWTRASLQSWKRFIYGLCKPAEKNASALKSRHQLIAKAFQKRHEMQQGHFSLSLNSMCEDPVGMNLEVNSVASKDVSSSWAAALPQFLIRRNAVTGIAPFTPRHYSSASDISRHVSDSFNQQNMDSLSMQISEQDFVAHALRHQRRKTRKERERFLKANRIAPWFPGNRRGSDTSLQSSLVAASFAAAAAKNMATKVTKSTSTGDLGTILPIPTPSVVAPTPTNRGHLPRQAINPPFTHGMTDNCHRFQNRRFAPSSSGPRLTQSASVVPNPMMGVIQTPIFGQSYEMVNTLPCGFMAGGMYPSMYPATQDLNYAAAYSALSYMPFGTYPNADSVISHYQQNLIPLLPRVDSASDADFFPIVLSESEVTDAGHRSYDESQFYANQRFIPQHMTSQSISAQAEVSKPSLEPQACAKTQFLKRMGSFSSKTQNLDSSHLTSSCTKSSHHSEAPPPSPVESSKSLQEDAGNGVSLKKELSVPHLSDAGNVFERFRAKLRRAVSLSQNNCENEKYELDLKPSSISLDELSKVNVLGDSLPTCRTNRKEKCSNLPENINLLQSNENVSR